MKPMEVVVTLLVLLNFNLVFPRALTEAEAELPVVQQLPAVVLDVYQTEEARQGAATDRQHLYAIDNSTIAIYEKTGGSLITRWEGIRGSPIGHLNSCLKRRNSSAPTPISLRCPWPALLKSLLLIPFSTPAHSVWA